MGGWLGDRMECGRASTLLRRVLPAVGTPSKHEGSDCHWRLAEATRLLGLSPVLLDLLRYSDEWLIRELCFHGLSF